MAAPKYTIPPQYESELELEPNPNLDPRGDAEILSSLHSFRPVTSEKNIWAFWHSGVATMPPWCARNVAGWVRMCSPDWTVRVLDNDPSSPNYVLNYMPASAFPDCFVSRTMDGAHSGQHAADFVRTATLLHHGGAYIDIGSLMIRHIDRVCWDVLADERRKENVAVPVLYGTFMANSFVAARKGDPFIEAWHTLFTHLWHNRTNSTNILSHPLIAALDLNLFDEATHSSTVRDSGLKVTFAVPMRVAYEYVTQVLCFQRLCRLSPRLPSSFNPSEYWQNHILAIPNIPELHPLEQNVGFEKGGRIVFDYLRMPADKERALENEWGVEEWKEASEMVWMALARGSFEKVMRGKNMTTQATLGALWDEQSGADCGEGTWAEVLRWGACGTRQRREEVGRMENVRPEEILEKGVLEA